MLRLARITRSALLMALGVAPWLGLSGCGPRHVEDTAPTPPVAAAPLAQQALRELEDEWQAQGPRGRVTLAPRFEDFLRRYPNDPGALRIAVLYGWVEMEQGRLAQAERVLSPALTAPESANRDRARVVQAAVLTRRGKPESALELLTPLRGKLVDEDFSELFGQERVKAALLARRWRLVVSALTEWLGETTRRPERVHESARRALSQVPSHALLRLLSEEAPEDDEELEEDDERLGNRTEAQEEKKRQAEIWVERSVIEQLSRTALRDQDPRLARQLLTLAPSWLRASDEGDRLAVLAASGGFDARIEGRTVGFVYSEHDALARRRSADASSGIVEALGLGRGQGAGDVRFVMRESRGDLTGALSALAGEGASILVAGVDDASATVALAFAEGKQVPVLVLADPADRTQGLKYGFVVGASLAQERHVLTEELARHGARAAVVVGPGGVGCDTEPAFPGGPRFPVLAWQRDAYDGVVVLGDGACADEVLRETRAARYTPLLGLGLDAARGRRRSSGSQSAIVLQPETAAPSGASWYQLLGRDAARLAQVALAALPVETAVERDAVRLHLDRARSALAQARATLESTSAQGFGGAQVLPRKLRALSGDEVSSTSASPSSSPKSTPPHAE
jgi:hypothetical protein